MVCKELKEMHAYENMNVCYVLPCSHVATAGSDLYALLSRHITKGMLIWCFSFQCFTEGYDYHRISLRISLTAVRA